MATLADVWSRLIASGIERGGQVVRRMDTSTRVRPFANEDILFYMKRIDNTGVIRATDPAARGICWKLIGSMVGATVLLIGVLLPSAYGLMAGREIQTLHQESQRMAAEQASLELQESRLLTPARMEELAREQQFVDPAPQRVVYLDGQGQQGTFAMNRK